jgi:predicted transcriptional regulator
MPPTTLKLSPELKRRIQAIVADTGQSAHAFMLEAIERQTAAAEQRGAFVSAALAARADFQRTRTGFAARDVHDHFRARAAGRKPRALKAKR